MDEFVTTQRGTTRRDFLKAGGALVVSFSVPGCAVDNAARSSTALPAAGAAWPATVDGECARLVASHRRRRQRHRVGGQDRGRHGHLDRVHADRGRELDVPIDRVTIVMGDTATTVDQRGTGGPTGSWTEARRYVARRRKGAPRFFRWRRLAWAFRGRPSGTRGVVYVANDESKRVSYGELIGGRTFDVKVSEKPKFKDARDYRVMGQPVPRLDIPPKVTGEYRYIGDFSMPGMLHARVVRPPEAGATVVSVDESAKLPGLVRVVRRGNFVAVVCEREEQAIEAARKLRVEWSKPAPMFWTGYDGLYELLRKEKPKATKEEGSKGDTEAALKMGGRVVEARYEYPFQSHASMGPACAVADVRDGGAVVWFGGQKPYPMRHALADLLKLPAEKVRVVWMPGPGSYGMNDADDCAADAALIAQAVGRPYACNTRGRTEPDGTRRARRSHSTCAPAYPATTRFSRGTTKRADSRDAFRSNGTGASRRYARRAARRRLQGEELRLAAISRRVVWLPERAQGEPHDRLESFHAHGIAHRAPSRSGRHGHLFRFRVLRRRDRLRDEDGSGGFPPALYHRQARGGRGEGRRRESRLGETRWAEPTLRAHRHGSRHCVRAAQPFRRGDRRQRRGGYADGPVSRDALHLRARLRLRGESLQPARHHRGEPHQAMSRARHEAVRFDEKRVLSVDWITYPIVDMTEVPDAIDIVILNNRPEARSLGAGEPSSRPVAAAIANALFDATGVRLRRCPLTPESLLAGLKA